MRQSFFKRKFTNLSLCGITGKSLPLFGFAFFLMWTPNSNVISPVSLLFLYSLLVMFLCRKLDGCAVQRACCCGHVWICLLHRVNGCARACCCGNVWICLLYRGMRCFLSRVVRRAQQRLGSCCFVFLAFPLWRQLLMCADAVGAVVLA